MLNKIAGVALAAALMVPFAASAADAPPAFNVCKACHKVEAGKNAVGPSLFGVFGAKAGHVADYKYSDAHKNSGLTWDEPTLTKYLADPKATVPGNKMVFPGVKDPAAIAALIEYLKTLK